MTSFSLQSWDQKNYFQKECCNKRLETEITMAFDLGNEGATIREEEMVTPRGLKVNQAFENRWKYQI